MDKSQPAPPETYRITGMDCADCARSIERGVSRLDGVSACDLDFGAAMLKVDGPVDRAAVVARVRELGYGVEDALPGAAKVHGASPAATAGGIRGFFRFMASRRDTTLVLLGALLILPGVLFDELLHLSSAPSPLLTASSLAALILAGTPIARSAWRSVAINHEINMNVLMTIAAVGAVLIGATTEAGLVMVLFAFGEALEGYTMERARDSIRGLVALAPSEAVALRPCLNCREHLGQPTVDGSVYTGGPCPWCGLEEQRIGVEELCIGDTLIVKPGERIPMDGRIAGGASAVNQAPITGESLPVDKGIDDAVFAGSINGQGALKVEVTRLAADNTLSRMVQLIQDAQARRAPAQRFVDRFARYYTPAVVGIAALVAVLPPVVFGAPFLGEQGWLYRALELLVVACPCALVISTPVAVVSAIGNAARHGVLIKGGASLEALAKVRAIAFDKTGTLTAGRPSVVAVRSVSCADPANGPCEQCDELLAVASAVERHSEHPLARAVVGASSQRGLHGMYPAAESVSALAGKGVTGRVNGRAVSIGSHTYFHEIVADHPEHCDEIEAAAQNGHTPMLVSVDHRYAGFIAVADTVRGDGRAVVDQLKAAGVEHLVMLTGDNAAVAQGVAQQLGLTDVRANLLPEQKTQAVEALREQYGGVAMVGDGINDAPALAAATVGIAMGASGSAQAMETADVALMSDDLTRLPFTLRLSRAAMRTIRVNVALSIGIKAIFFVLVLLGLGSMWMAVFADMGTSLLVTLNGMRLLRYGG